MMVLITYDVTTETKEGQKRLRKVAKCCEDYGQRVQNSVFECLVDPIQLAEIKHKLENIINEDIDSIRYYYLVKNGKRRVEHIGAKISYDPEGPLII